MTIHLNQHETSALLKCTAGNVAQLMAEAGFQPSSEFSCADGRMLRTFRRADVEVVAAQRQAQREKNRRREQDRLARRAERQSRLAGKTTRALPALIGSSLSNDALALLDRIGHLELQVGRLLLMVEALTDEWVSKPSATPPGVMLFNGGPRS